MGRRVVAKCGWQGQVPPPGLAGWSAGVQMDSLVNTTEGWGKGDWTVNLEW